MKVILVGDFPEGNKMHGGVQGVLTNLANELVLKSDIELVLVSLNKRTTFENFNETCATYKLTIRPNILSAKNHFNAICRKEQPDIIHIQGVVPGVLLFNKNFGNKFVVTQHAILAEERLWQVSLKRKILFRLKEKVEDYYLNKINNIIFISKYNKDIYFSRFKNWQNLKYELIPNPVNTIFFQQEFSKKVRNPNEMYFLGEVKKRKGLHVLLKSVKLLKNEGIDCKLHVIGGFKEKRYQEEINDLVESLEIEKNIIFPGWMSQEEIIVYTKNIPVFVLPSFQETLPLSIAEAMCLGKIVVGTNICGVPEMIEDGKTGFLFAPGDHESLAVVLETLFGQTNDELERLSKNAKKASSKYNPKDIVNHTITFYKSIAK